MDIESIIVELLLIKGHINNHKRSEYEKGYSTSETLKGVEDQLAGICATLDTFKQSKKKVGQSI